MNDIQKQERDETTRDNINIRIHPLKKYCGYNPPNIFFHLQKNSLTSKDRDYIITEQPPSLDHTHHPPIFGF